MEIPHNKLIGELIAEVENSYRVEDTILYALSLGFGADPTDKKQLKYVYEDGLESLPSLALVLGYPGFWMKDPKYGFDWAKVLHAEETLQIHKPLPVEGTVVGRTTVDHIVDRGAEKGVFVYVKKDLIDKPSGDTLATVISNSLARGDGGFDGPTEARPRFANVPEREADVVCDLPTLPQAALVYRLCGDMNPLHADPDVASGAGFERPILHGRCTLGVALHAIIKGACDYQASQISDLQVRFSAPFLPGETLRTEMWREGTEVFFRASCLERSIVVLNNGRVTLKR
ncbi:MAG: MaoC/PaaZ C-terminal domain-containing protein [Pseudomonadota bacterium]